MNRWMLSAGVLLCCLLADGLAASEVEHAATVSRNALESHIDYLASDRLGGRGVDTSGIERAAEYIAGTFARYDLLPGGDEASYYQTFQIPIRRHDPAQTELVLRDLPVNCTLGDDYTALPFSAEGTFEGPLCFAGYGITNPDRQHDDYDGLDVSGKVVLMFRYEPDGWGRAPEGRRSRHASFRSKMRLAREHGARAVLIVNPPGDEQDRLMGGTPRRDFGLPAFHISRRMADAILGAAKAPTLNQIHRDLDRHRAAVGAKLANLEARGRIGVQTTEVSARNVVGILPGQGDLAREYVVFGAHYDHLGTVPPTRRPQVGVRFDPEQVQIHNGADDNASGTAGILELARLYAGGPAPRRSLCFIAFTAEEMGLIGSEHFVSNPTIALEHTVSMFNLDMIGRLEGRQLQVYGTKTAEQFELLLDKHAAAVGLDLQKMPSLGYGSDHAPFYRKKIPVLFPFAGMHEDYHRPGDDSEKIDYEGVTRIVELVKRVADEVIASDTLPTYQKVESSPPMAGGNIKVRLGIVPDYVPDDEQPGWGVREVLEGGPAGKAGLRDGDRILKIAGRPVNGFADYMEIMPAYKPGDEVQVVVRRGEQELRFTVRLEAR